MRKIIAATILCVAASVSAQTTYDSTTLVDTNNNSTSTSTVTSTNTNTNTNNNTNTTTVNSTSTNTNVNTNNNVNSGEQTFNNNNVNTSTSTATNTNNNTSTSTSTNTNTNNSTNTSTSTNTNQNVNTGDMTNRNINNSNIEQTVKSPPPSAIAPAMMSGGGNDLCTTGVSGAVQTQILGISGGSTVRDLNCERLKNAKTLYDMGMKVAAVSVMCQDRRIFDAMWHAGTPCPFEGMIGNAAKLAWEAHPDRIPKPEVKKEDDTFQKIGIGLGIAAVLGIVF